MNLKEIIELKKQIPEYYILYDYINKTFLKWQNYRNGGQISGCQGFEGRWQKGLLRVDRAAPCPDCAGRCKNIHTIKLHRTKLYTCVHTRTNKTQKILKKVKWIVPISVAVTLNRSSTRCCRRGNGDGTADSFCVISYNCVWLYNYLKIES